MSSRSAKPGTQPGGTLTIAFPPELARTLALTRGSLVLGRQTNHPAGELPDGTVSRQHVSIGWDGRSRSHVAADLGSRNGSWLDGAPLSEARVALHDGAVLRMGAVVAVYEQGAPDLDDDASLAATIPGNSGAMRRLRRLMAQAATDPSPVLVVGPTGAGKEHVVRALHRLSGRSGPLVAVNVTELSPQLAESQLFGHVKGAFTGANQAQPGLFRAAEGGTLFLDELGELSSELQPKLLRVIQEQEVRPVGGTRTERVDVRVVAATNRDLSEDIEAGRFRRDLWARLSLWELRVPALAERRADLPRWITRLHRRWCDERERDDPPLEFEPEAIEALLLTDWPENLRGVDRLVHRLAVEADGEPISRARIADVLGLPVLDGGGTPAAPTGSSAVEATLVKRPAPESAEELSEVLARFEGSVRAAARWYGRDRRQIYRWIDALGLERDGSD